MCPICGGELVKRATGPKQKYCSANCSSLAYYRRNRADISAKRKQASAEARALVVKRCPTCGAEFSPEKSLGRKYCSEKCCSAATRDVSSRACSEVGCVRPVRARGVCSMHYKRLLRAEGKLRSVWDDRRRSNYHARRARKKGAGAVPVNSLEIFERDGWVCGICFGVVDRAVVYPHPLSPSLDHVFPLSRGGVHAPENVQLAHLRCNVSKGDSVVI